MTARFTFLFFFFIAILPLSKGQLNVSLLSNVPMPGTIESADIWGYVDGNGIEYAIIGTEDGTRIFSLENPATPILRAVISGDVTSWRDMKSYGDYVYSVQDVNGDDGLVIIDMSSAPGTITHTFWSPSLTVDGVTDDLEQVHNLFIDEDGYAYLSGSNIASGGIIILDLFTTPGTPIHVGETDLRYSHDVYVQDDTMYTSEIFAGEFRVFDVTDKTNPILLASQGTGRTFTHNAWASVDGNTLFTTDERADAYVESYDISDLNNISRLDRYRPLATEGTGVIPHNVHVINDFLVISHYSDGVVIVDAAQPDNLIRVGQYDTYTGSSTGFNGCWGTTPFLPSGVILASDISSGLFVLDPTYVRACYLRGEVRDINTNATIVGVDIEIVSTDLNQSTTNNFGQYATGIVTPGNYDVTFSHPSYSSKTVNVDLVTGQTELLDVFLGSSSTCSSGTNNTVVPISENGANLEYESVINFATGGTVTDVNVTNITGLHSYLGDLTFYLIGPDSTVVQLNEGECGTDENFNVGFDDGASSSTLACPYDDGTVYIPSQSLSAFNGLDAAGDWTLVIVDAANLDGGELQSWSLEVCIDVSSSPCVADLSLPTVTTGTYKAANSILSNAVVASTDSVIFEAGGFVELQPDFEVELSGILYIDITPCTSFNKDESK